jgi:hypothetical protein
MSQDFVDSVFYPINAACLLFKIRMTLSYPLQTILSIILVNLSPLNKKVHRNYNGSLLYLCTEKGNFQFQNIISTIEMELQLVS